MFDDKWMKRTFQLWLRQWDMKITFTKANGETRIMHCTLRPETLPPNDKPLNMEETVEGSSEAIRVWDLEKKAWRSFRPSTVTDALILYKEENET